MPRKKRKSIKHAVVILNYNNWQDTQVCLESVSKTKDTPHIIVVDNASTNDSVKELRARFPQLDLIVSKRNLGYSGGNNLGIKKALRMGAKVIHLLNNDTEVDKNLFYRAYRYTSGKNRLSGGKIYYAKGFEYHPKQRGKGNVLWYAGGQLDWSTATAKHAGVDEVDQGQYDKPRDVNFVTGCYMAVPRRIFNRIGMLDESFFLYLEDADFTLRAISAGYEARYNPNLILYHRNGGSTGAGSGLVDYYLTRNRFALAKRYGSLRLRLALLREAIFRNWGSRIRRTAFMDFLAGRMRNRNEKINKILKKTAK